MYTLHVYKPNQVSYMDQSRIGRLRGGFGAVPCAKTFRVGAPIRPLLSSTKPPNPTPLKKKKYSPQYIMVL